MATDDMSAEFDPTASTLYTATCAAGVLLMLVATGGIVGMIVSHSCSLALHRPVSNRRYLRVCAYSTYMYMYEGSRIIDSVQESPFWVRSSTRPSCDLSSDD